jgi:sugar phosphate isomerase/epimerase
MGTSHELSRRSFVKTTAGLALAAGVMDLGNALLGAEKKKMPVGCRDRYLRIAGKPDSWSCMQALGAECTEVSVETNLACSNLFHPERKYTVATPDGIKALQDDLAASGCRISAFMMSNHLDEQLEKEVEAARNLVKAAQQLGVHAIRIDVVPRKRPPKSEEFLPFAIKACKQVCAVAEGTPVRFGVENHSTTTNDPKFLASLFDGVGSDKLGLTLDCANFYWWGHPLKDLYKLYAQFAPRVVHTHCKSIRYPDDKKNVRRPMGWEYAKYNCPIYEGDIDFKRLVSILRKANYPGDLCVEDESLDKYPAAEQAEVMRKEIAMLKALA